MMTCFTWRSILLAILFKVAEPYPQNDFSNNVDAQGPTFSVEPPGNIEFMNTQGVIVDCMARGNPQPNIQWLNVKKSPIFPISKIRHILSNGSLYFPPFAAENFRQDVHWTTYKCSASNTIGTIVSRDTDVKAVVPQRYEPEVQNPGGFIGCNILIKCLVPSFARNFVTVTSWLQEPNFNIYPSLEGDGKNHMLPTGELLVYNITKNDSQKMYRCRTHHRLTRNTLVSKNAGKIQLTEIRELVPPIINEKILKVRIRLGDPLVVACDAYANPKPIYRWHTIRESDNETLEHMVASGRAKTKDGTLIILAVLKIDKGDFFCTVTNSEGTEIFKLELSVTSPLSTIIEPSIQTVSLGHTADLICRTFGFPQQNIVWLKDGNILRTGSRVRLLSNERIHFSPIIKEDKGMYQCVLKNDWEYTQSSAEFRLGEVSPHFNYKFIEQTLQPGHFISLKCSCSGNPTPNIIWFLDGYTLPKDDRIMIGQYVTTFGDVISHVNITAAKSEDGGEYKCKAYSKAGEVSHSAFLNIYGLPYVRPMSFLSAVAGKQFSLRCPIAGYPIESVSIEKDGVNLPVNLRQRINNATLTIENIQRSADQGTYTCIARNKQNYTSMRSVELKVLVPPRISPFGFEEEITEGMRTQIMCSSSQGDQPFNITWFKNDIPIRKSIASTINALIPADQKRPYSTSSMTINQYAPFSSILSIYNVSS
ncbi:cell adhesion molecule Dscam2-like [Drosophila bipectinata]|uniref:cell adhesion molecule Dscam2-like n=1 Tax=Drosophila bipectinata TaxID=42026 RepID=UPI0038B2A963